MEENRDPKTCPSCNTVNPWMNAVCRTCGTSLEDIPAGMPASTSDPVEKPEEAIPQGPDTLDRIDGNQPQQDATHLDPRGRRNPVGSRRWNALWILIGLFFYFIAFSVGQMAIERGMIASNPERQAVYEQLQQNPGEVTEADQERYRALFMPVIIVVGILILITPLLIGAVVGFYTQSIIEGTVAMGMAALFAFLLNGGQALEGAAVALVAALLNAGLGALGTFAGMAVHRKIKPQRNA
ncbi:MAG: hypothetical protein QNJ97_14985 [Myxococcota bacterium]|nr:hypothetical protein [Myxococcota bacterium]